MENLSGYMTVAFFEAVIGRSFDDIARDEIARAITAWHDAGAPRATNQNPAITYGREILQRLRSWD